MALACWQNQKFRKKLGISKRFEGGLNRNFQKNILIESPNASETLLINRLVYV